MKYFLGFIVDILDVLAWPLLVLAGGGYFREEIKSIMSRVLDGEAFGFRVKLQSKKEYTEDIRNLESSRDAAEKERIAKKLLEPGRKRLTTEEGADLVAKDLIRKMESEFDLVDIENAFLSLFSSDPKKLEYDAIQAFKRKVLVSVRSSKEVIENQSGNGVSFKKI